MYLYLNWQIVLGSGILCMLLRLIRNIRKAKATGLPYVISPIHELGELAYITTPILRWYYRQHLMGGRGYPRYARFMIKDWHYEDKGRTHEELGSVFLVVSPGGLVCYIADPDAALSVLTRRKAFVKPRSKMKMLEPFGPNIVSTDGDAWRFHSRVTLPSFGDGVQSLVWEETRRQTDMICQSWRTGQDDVKDNVYGLSMNITSHAIFGQQTDGAGRPSSDRSVSAHSKTLVEALTELVQRLPYIMLLPKWLLRIIPDTGCQIAYTAYCETEQYMNEFLAEEHMLCHQRPKGGEHRKNLLTSLLFSSTVTNMDAKPPVVGPRGMTTEEIKGNIFIFLLAGYETTANTIIYSCIVLALHPDLQARACEEVDAIYRQLDQVDNGDLSYPTHFHKFRYLLALMYEVLRVFPTALGLARQVESDQELTIQGRHGQAPTKAILPAGAGAVVNVTGAHHLESNWRSPHVIEPRRWLSEAPNTFDPLNPPSLAGRDTSPISAHRKGTFLTFGDGARACLGRSIARVEYVAFFSRLLRSYELCLPDGVSEADLEWLLRCRTGGSPVALQLPEKVRLRLVPRYKV